MSKGKHSDLHEKIKKLTQGHYEVLINTQKLLDQSR